MQHSKALVEIKVPACGKTFDVYIPLDSKMSDVTKLVSASLESLSEGNFKSTQDSALCNADTGELYNVNLYVEELGIKNGSRMILI